MIKKTIILVLSLTAIMVSSVGVSPCPIADHNGTVYSGKYLLYLGQVIVAVNGGIVPLTNGQDTQCYNYSLPYAFIRVPEVAIGNFIN